MSEKSSWLYNYICINYICIEYKARYSNSDIM